MANRRIVPEAKNSRAAECDAGVGSICHFAGQKLIPNFRMPLSELELALTYGRSTGRPWTIGGWRAIA